MSFSQKLIGAVAVALPQLALAGLDRECFFVQQMYGPKDTEGTQLKSDLPLLVAMYEPGMVLQSVVVSTDEEYDDYFVGIQANLMNHQTKERLALSSIQDELIEWTQRKYDFIDPIDGVTIRWDTSGVCDLTFLVNGTETHMSQSSEYCNSDNEEIFTHEVSVSDATPLVGFHGLVDEDALVGLGLIMVDALEPECQKNKDNSNMFSLGGGDLGTTAVADLFESQITERETERAKLLDALLHYDRITDAKYSKEELILQIKDLIETRPIVPDENGKPESPEDIQLLFQRFTGEELTEGEAWQIYDGVVNDSPFQFVFHGQTVNTFEELVEIQNAYYAEEAGSSYDADRYDNGKTVNDFADLVELDNYARQEEINELIKAVDDYEDIIMDNEDFFDQQYGDMQEDIDALTLDIEDYGDELQLITDMINDAEFNVEEQEIASAALEAKLQASMNYKGDVPEDFVTEEEIEALVAQGLRGLALVSFMGVLLGALLVTLCMCCQKRDQQKRRAEMQMNPAFKFADSTDPSGTASGIPASNPIADEELNKGPMKTDGDNINTERGMIDSPTRLPRFRNGDSDEKNRA